MVSNVDRPRMKLVLLMAVVSVLIASGVLFNRSRNSQSTVDLTLQLIGDQLLCDGRAAGPDWLQGWRKKLDAVIESEDKGGTSSKGASVRTRRLLMRLDSQLAYGVFQDLLMEGASCGFTN